MSKDYTTNTIIISKQSEIERLFNILNNLPIVYRNDKSFRSNSEYKKFSTDYEESFFEMKDVFIGDAQFLDNKLEGFLFLNMGAWGHNCLWNPKKFLSCNSIGYEWLVNAVNAEDPYGYDLSLENHQTKRCETFHYMDLGEDGGGSNESEANEYMSYGLGLFHNAEKLYDDETFKQRSDMYKLSFETKDAIESLE